jgi:hypothetical protein
MQGAQNLRSEAYWQVRRNDEGEAQRRRSAFYEAIMVPPRREGLSLKAWLGNLLTNFSAKCNISQINNIYI